MIVESASLNWTTTLLGLLTIARRISSFTDSLSWAPIGTMGIEEVEGNLSLGPILHDDLIRFFR